LAYVKFPFVCGPQDLYQQHRISEAAYRQGQAEYQRELAKYENQIAKYRGTTPGTGGTNE
jgi:hypothetical protein